MVNKYDDDDDDDDDDDAEMLDYTKYRRLLNRSF